MSTATSTPHTTRSSPTPPGAPPPIKLRCTNTAEFLAVLPLLTGFTDQNSLFIVLFQGSLGCRALRMDLPETQSASHLRKLCDGVIALLHDTGAGRTGPGLVISTGQRFADTGDPPWARLASELKHAFRRAGWPLRELAVLAADGWCELLSDSPGRPRALSEITDTEFARSLRSLSPAPAALTTIGLLPTADPIRAAAVATHLTELRDRSSAAGTNPTSVPSLGSVRATAGLAEACFAAVGTAGTATGEAPAAADTVAGPPARSLAKLVAAAQSHPLWVVLVLTALTRAEFVVSVTRESGLQRLTEIEIDSEATTAAAQQPAWSIYQLLQSLAHELPERAKLYTAVRLFADATAHAPRSERPPLYALLAWAWWLLGLQSVAARILAQALAIRPDHELALMVQRLIASPPAAHVAALRETFQPPA